MGDDSRPRLPSSREKRVQSLRACQILTVACPMFRGEVGAERLFLHATYIFKEDGRGIRTAGGLGSAKCGSRLAAERLARSRAAASGADWLALARWRGRSWCAASMPRTRRPRRSRACAVLPLAPFDGSESAAPRTEVAPRVWTANEAPPSATIPFHHEMAQCGSQPRYVLFFCQTPPAVWGCTPLVRSEDVARSVRACHPDAAAELDERGIRYRRTLPAEEDPESPVGRSWPVARSTRRVGAPPRPRCGRAASSGGGCRTARSRRSTPNVPCLRTRRTARAKCFSTRPSRRCADGAARARAAGQAIVFGDDRSALTDASLALFEHAYYYTHHAARRVRWRSGDLMILDNRRVMHARDPFIPPRRILASMADDLASPDSSAT